MRQMALCAAERGELFRGYVVCVWEDGEEKEWDEKRRREGREVETVLPLWPGGVKPNQCRKPC